MGNYSSTGAGVSGLKESLTGKGKDSKPEGGTCWFPPAPQSLLFRAAPPAWPLPHGCGVSPCSGAGCPVSSSGQFLQPVLAPLQGCPSPPPSVSCLTVLSELESCPAWWKGTFFKELVLPIKLCQCDYVQDLDQHFCSQCSDLGPVYVWLIAWFLM